MQKLSTLIGMLMLLGACAADSESPIDRDVVSLNAQHGNVQLASNDSNAAAVAQTQGDEEELFPYEDVEEDVNDPLETPNRFIFAANETLDVLVIKPAAMTYRFLVPDGVRDSIRNFLRNLRSPVILANDVFQGDEERVNTTFKRFFINSTIGIGGLFDVAEDMGHPFHDEDFGQTLGTYGVGEGFYLVLPLLGPSSARDGTGLVVDYFLDPLTYLLDSEILLARAALTGLDKREQNIETLEEIKKDSVDFYARIRSLYRQDRELEIRNGVIDDEFEVPGVSGEIGSVDMEASLQATDRQVDPQVEAIGSGILY